MEKVALTCTPPCVKNSTGEELLYNTGALCDGLEGGVGGVGGRLKREKVYVYTHSCFTLLYKRN